MGLSLAAIAAGPATTSVSSTTEPTTAPATTQAVAIVDPAAEPLLEKIKAAYTAAGPWHFVGQMTGDFDVAGRAKRYHLSIDGRTDGAGRFRHDAGDAGTVVGDGAQVYFYDTQRDSYGKVPTTQGRQPATEVDESVISVLLDENPGLLLTLTDDPAALLRRAAKTIKPAPATQPGEAGLVLDQTVKRITLWASLADGTIRATEVDYTPLMAARHATAVKAAKATLVYTHTGHEVPSADAFHWQPAATATEFEIEHELVRAKPAVTQPATAP